MGEGKERGEGFASEEDEWECGAGMLSGLLCACGAVGSEEVVGRGLVGVR